VRASVHGHGPALQAAGLQLRDCGRKQEPVSHHAPAPPHHVPGQDKAGVLAICSEISHARAWFRTYTVGCQDREVCFCITGEKQRFQGLSGIQDSIKKKSGLDHQASLAVFA